MGKCILPFTIDVEMKAYHDRAFPLGVMKANLKNYDVWLCNKLINCIYFENNSVINAYDKKIWSYAEGLMHKEGIDLSREEFNAQKPDILSKNREMLEDGRYITGTFDDYFIPGKNVYQKRHFWHNYIIFGYDDEKRVYKSAAYLANGQYDFLDITYEDYYDSITKSEYPFYVYYWKLNKSYEVKIDIQHIKRELENYLLSRADERMHDAPEYYGMEAWQKFKEYVQNIGDNNLDNRFGRIFMEHRAIMAKRIEKLSEMGYIRDSSLAEIYRIDVYLPAQAVHNLFIKYNLTKDIKVKMRILENIQKANENEERIICKVLNSTLVEMLPTKVSAF